jgi:glycerol-3-phosphate dehydrogenase
MMIRDLRRLADTPFDVLVIGGGFYGVTVAWDAAQRGLSVALIDKGDFGGATSFNNLKTLHGGLRSLQSLNLRQMRLFIRERRALARIVPHLVRPLPFVVPTTNAMTGRRMAWHAVLAFNDAVSNDRNDGLPDPATHLPAGRVVGRDEALRLNPLVSPDGVTGGAVWYDYQMISTDRVTLSFLLSATRAGAISANYVRADRLLREHGRITGVEATDVRSGEGFAIHASVVVNAAGPWAASLLAELPVSEQGAPPPALSRAMNLVIDPVTTTHACGGKADGRFLFVVPWGNVSIVGTSHDAHDGTADQLRVSGGDVDDFLGSARRAFPQAGLSTANVRLVHRGLLPMVSGHDSHVQLVKESRVVDHSTHGLRGLVSVFSVRYTTARHTAEEAVDAVFSNLGYPTPPLCRTDTTPLLGGEIDDLRAFLSAAEKQNLEGISAISLRRIATTYGSQFEEVLALADDEPSLREPLGLTCEVTGAEILHAARHESAVSLSDAVLRRTAAGSAGHPGRDAIARAAAIMGDALGWDPSRRRTEVDAVERIYDVPNEISVTFQREKA